MILQKTKKKLNILDVMHGVSVVWQSIMPVVIQNCFAKCGFSTGSLVSTNDEEENCQRVELKGHIDSPITFKKFCDVHISVLTRDDQPTSLESPGPSSVHVIGEE
jgi:hypothetical protein